jgi:geranylgeranyl diphosphate synthase type I
MLKAIEEDLKVATTLPKAEFSQQLKAMIDHHMGWLEGQQPSGKRIRPLLTLLTCHATGGRWQNALPAASSVELIHNFSLVHDDIEDDSETRRGRPTVWKLWGMPQAINTGDAMFALARSSTKRLQDEGYTHQTILQVEQELDRALLHLTLGQHLDLLFETEDSVSIQTYLEMIEGKTAALLQAATTIGGLLSERPAAEIEQLAQFGRHVGLAFQITDDTLGIWGDPSVTGKPSGDDLLHGKKSLPVLYGLQQSEGFRRAWKDEKLRSKHMADMMDELDACGARDFSLEQASKHTQSALQSVREVVADESANEELYALANRLLKREH